MGKAGNGYIYAGSDFQRTYPMTGVLRYNPQSENLQIYYNGWRNLSTGGSGGGETIYYSAGNGISISEENVISVNSSIVALKSEIPTKTSDLTNDSGFIASAPVSSVNGLTGNVDISDIIMPGTAVSIDKSGNKRVISVKFQSREGFQDMGLTGGLALNFDVVAKKEYVDKQIGNINSILDAINGEVI